MIKLPTINIRKSALQLTNLKSYAKSNYSQRNLETFNTSYRYFSSGFKCNNDKPDSKRPDSKRPDISKLNQNQQIKDLKSAGIKLTKLADELKSSKLSKQLTDANSKLSKQLMDANSKLSKQLTDANKQFAELKPEIKKQITEAKPQIAEFTKDLYTIPNIMTMARIASSPVIGWLIIKGYTDYALSLFTVSCLTDWVDGYIARKYNQQSIVGSIIDPLADKLLMTICTLSLAYAQSIPAFVATLIIGRDVMLSFMSFYYRYKSIAPPKSLTKFLDIKGNPTITVHPTMLGKVNTGLQMVYIGGLMIKPVIHNLIDLTTFFDGFGILVSITTILSGGTYLFGKNAFKYIKK